MRFRLWRREEPEPVIPEEAPAEPAPPPAEPAPAPPPAEPAPAHATEPASEAPAPLVEEPEPEKAPAQVALTIDEAKDAIREAGGDVIQVGFLASAYRRHLEEDPHSAETANSRKKLGDLVGKRLKDRGLLASDGTFELREDASA